MNKSGFPLLSVLLFFSLGRAQASPPNWQAILNAFGEKAQAAVAYRETEHVGLLYAKLKAKGLWCYRRPDHLTDIMLSPVRKRYGMNRKEAWSISAQGRRRTIALVLVPSLHLLAQTLESLLSGHARELHRLFHEFYRIRAKRWTLLLKPRDDTETKSLQAIELRGLGPDLEHLTIRYQNGDWSHYRLTPVPWRRCQKEGS